jgi:hypothetical protein
MTVKKQIFQQFLKKQFSCVIKCISLLVVVLAGITANAQRKDKDEIKDLFNFYREHHFQEKIYIHTDNSLYITGEILWCKVYVTDAHLHHLSEVSKTAYIEIIDANQKPVWQASIGIENGKGEASLVIPSSISTGNYVLRSYTNWMKNFDPAFYFEKTITIINPLKKPVTLSTESDTKLMVDFFPEGGQLVTGLPSSLAIKFSDASGEEIHYKNAILISSADTIVRFKTNEKGMGKCMFTPKEGNTYDVRIQKTETDWQSFSLPEIIDRGYTMLLDDSDPETITITVNTNWSPAESSCYLFIHCRQVLIQAFSTQYKNGKANFKLLKSGIGEGISHFTVFNENRQPVMERLYFNKPEKLLKINVSANKETFNIREKVTLDIESILPGGIFSDATLSASVIKLNAADNPMAADIVSYFYLQSDLPGMIESPASFLKNESKEMVDLLMLTYGWRRFKWNDIINKSAPAFDFLPEYSGQIISGELVDKNRQATGAGKTAYASIPSNRYKFGITRSNEEGMIHFPFSQQSGTAVLALQADLKKDSLFQVDWHSPFIKNYSLKKIPVFSISEKSEAAIRDMITEAQLQQVYSGEKMNAFLPPVITDTTAFFGLPDKNYFLDNYTRFSTIEEIFREFIPEVEIRKNKSNYRIRVNNLPYKAFFKDEPLMLLDGIPVTDVNQVMQFDPLKIKNIGIVARRYYVAGFTYPGIISFQTYDGDMTGISLNPRVLLVDYEGIQVRREFYSPQYTTDKQLQNRLPDLRRLLYWEPDINTGVTGKARRSFYTADLPGKYAIIVEGMNDKGFVGSSLTYFEVK